MKKKRDEALSTQNDTTIMSNPSNQQTARPTLADAPRLMEMLTSPNATERILVDATRDFRRMLTVQKNIPARDLIKMGILPYLVRNLAVNTPTSSVTLIFESAWTLTNIAATECGTDVAQAGAVKPLIRLLRHCEVRVRDQAIWCLGNIAGEGPALRDLILQEQPIDLLLQNIGECRHMDYLQNIVWTMSSLCRGDPKPPTNVTSKMVFPLVSLLDQGISAEVTIDILWALNYLSDHDEKQLDLVVCSGVAHKLIRLLGDDKFKRGRGAIPVVKILGNFVAGNEIQTQTAIDSGILNHLSWLLGNKKKALRKEASWLASNIAGGSVKQITMLVDTPRILEQIINIAKADVWLVRKEALFAVANICTCGNQKHIMALVDAGGLESLVCALQLESIDPTMLVGLLEALITVLKVGESFTDLNYIGIIEECNGVDFIENLQTHPNDEVYRKAIYLIETYLGAAEEADENLAPVTNDSGTFGFGFDQGLASPKQLFAQFDEPEDSSSNNGALPFGSVSTNAFFGSTKMFYPV